MSGRSGRPRRAAQRVSAPSARSAGAGLAPPPVGAALHRVAEVYLDAPADTPLVLALAASADTPQLAQLERAIVRAARRLGIELPPELPSGRATRPVRAAAPADPPAVAPAPRARLLNAGVVDERRLDRLAPPGGDGPDLLLWLLPLRAQVSLRALYLLCTWVWASAPRYVRCLLPGPPGRREAARAAVEGA
jgi:hypothetical protein